ncbi:MAG: gliding motility-associated C-terminal domain-containing protein, partial [Bacteroidales bacterium]|nr:gliding motility-associated C-terminal domain-containing protein [Bacteroidales bacterium]
PAKLKANVDVTSPSCIGNNDGMLEISATGGTQPYNYSCNERVTDLPMVSSLYQGVYAVVVTDANGCTFRTNAYIEDSEADCLRIPNVFTPNSDGINDTWEIDNLHMFPDADIFIFNRWGQLMYSAKGNEAGWDGLIKGHIVPAGVYTYIIDLHTSSEIYQGTVTIVY